MRFDDIQGNQLAKRALEIATTGGHSIRFVGDEGAAYHFWCLAIKLGVSVSLDADIVVEVIDPTWECHGENHEAILARIEGYEIDEDLTMTLGALSFLDAAQRYALKKNLRCDAAAIVRVARTITSMAGANEIHAAHMAEAIQYTL